MCRQAKAALPAGRAALHLPLYSCTCPVRRPGSRPIEAAVPARPWRSQYTELCWAATISGIVGSCAWLR